MESFRGVIQVLARSEEVDILVELSTSYNFGLFILNVNLTLIVSGIFLATRRLELPVLHFLVVCQNGGEKIILINSEVKGPKGPPSFKNRFRLHSKGRHPHMEFWWSSAGW